ncbi:hypothetical protein [Salinibacterium sp. SWN1162]|uniref:hypothetical protein n=1 Tax=Salinibacterium sp. SWN1162 TaxID=2792053 RepID=UPI0018CDAE6A|nr:hypothetical protein [Salinibacterium sp. SWN1162]MBH0009161.1 hypothetical protein [Salinibacterium sp. SWN1162]
MSVAEALRRVIVDESLETAVAAVDWALHSGRIDGFDFELLILTLPRHKRSIRAWVDSRSESLPESLARTRLTMRGHRVELQVPVGSKRIDLVVDGVIGVEVDGRRFHAHTFEQDRLKAIEMTIAGFHALSVSASMVFGQWELFLRALEGALGRSRSASLEYSGDTVHLRKSSPRMLVPSG